MTDSHDGPIAAHNSVGVEVAFESAQLLCWKCARECIARPLIEVHEDSTVVVVRPSPDIEQRRERRRRDTALLQPDLGMVGQCRHGGAMSW